MSFWKLVAAIVTASLILAVIGGIVTTVAMKKASADIEQAELHRRSLELEANQKELTRERLEACARSFDGRYC